MLQYAAVACHSSVHWVVGGDNVDDNALNWKYHVEYLGHSLFIPPPPAKATLKSKTLTKTTPTVVLTRVLLVQGGWPQAGHKALHTGGSMVGADRLNVPAIDTFSH